MTALTTESRGLLVTALTGHGFKVYGTAPAIPVTPSVVIVPDAPWITPERIGGRLAMIRSPVEISTLWLVVQYITEPSETAHL